MAGIVSTGLQNEDSKIPRWILNMAAKCSSMSYHPASAPVTYSEYEKCKKYNSVLLTVRFSKIRLYLAKLKIPHCNKKKPKHFFKGIEHYTWKELYLCRCYLQGSTQLRLYWEQNCKIWEKQLVEIHDWACSILPCPFITLSEFLLSSRIGNAFSKVESGGQCWLSIGQLRMKCGKTVKM